MSFIIRFKPLFNLIQLVGRKPHTLQRHLSIFLRKDPTSFNVLVPLNHNLNSLRCKSGKKKKQVQSEEESDDEDGEPEYDDTLVDKATLVREFRLASLRMDSVLKTGLGLSKHKIEEEFFNNKVRVNGRKFAKSGDSIKEGDEIDLIKGYGANSNFLIVGRVEVLSIVLKNTYHIKMRSSKSLIIENYKEEPWVSLIGVIPT